MTRIDEIRQRLELHHAWWCADLPGGREAVEESITDRKILLSELERWSLALQSLTPGGSEFVDDPERCVQFVRDARETQMRAVTKMKKHFTAELERKHKALRNIEVVLGDYHPKAYSSARRIAREALAPAEEA